MEHRQYNQQAIFTNLKIERRGLLKPGYYADIAIFDPDTIRETAVNEPLINWHSSEGDLALAALRQTSGWAGNASDKAMQSYSRMIREKEGLNVLPASMAGLIALLESHHKEPLPRDRYVAVLTGRR